jgi:hypothetical protein
MWYIQTFHWLYKSHNQTTSFSTTSEVCYRCTIYSIAKLVFFFSRYAFVAHRSNETARRNLHRSIDRSLLGSQCRVEYASHFSGFSSKHKSTHNKKIAVSRIPENVNENDLRYLFGNCHILKYCPARYIHSSATAMETKNKNKILSG